MSDLPDGDAPTDVDEDLQPLREQVADAGVATADATRTAAQLEDPTMAPVHLRELREDLVDAYQEVTTALDQVENVMRTSDAVSTETSKGITRSHSERFKDKYPGPVAGVALLLAEANRRKWLHGMPNSSGSNSVRRHGLTDNQRQILRDLETAWREYDD